jgi:pimeloyl-ACP methyl ester carboxylesterase
VQATLKEARCGVLIVPENRDDSGGREVRNSVAILPSQAEVPAPDPIVYLHGGPGATPMSIAGELVELGRLNRDRDLILMSQRGTLHSEPDLTCPSIDEATATAVGLGLGSPEARQVREEAARQCHDQSAAKADLDHYNTTESAADLDDLRQALGIHDWNVIGHSYGTDLALFYMREYPDHIRSVVIDGVVPTDIASFGIPWRAARESIDAMAAACQAQPDCGRRYGDIAKTFDQLLSETESEPVVTEVEGEDGKPVKVVLDPAALLSWVVVASHLPTEAPAAIGEMAEGKPQRLAGQYAFTRIDPEGFGQLAWGLFDSATCSEWDRGKDEVKSEGRKAFPDQSEALWSQVPQVLYQPEVDCPLWDAPEAPESLRRLPHNNIPTLVVNGSFDAQTAAANGKYVADRLPNAINVVINGAAHGTFFDDPCSGEVITSFIDHPNVPDTSCAPQTRPPPFVVE